MYVARRRVLSVKSTPAVVEATEYFLAVGKLHVRRLGYARHVHVQKVSAQAGRWTDSGRYAHVLVPASRLPAGSIL